MNRAWILILSIFLCLQESVSAVQDDIANVLTVTASEQLVHTDYNYESFVKIPIELKFISSIKSEGDLYEGQTLKFTVVKDVRYNGKTLVRRGDTAEADISVIITSGMNGIPASIILSNFRINSIDTGSFSNNCEIFGQDRSLFVFPLKWALTPLPPTGSLTNFIMGGHVRVKAGKRITIYYYPEWN